MSVILHGVTTFKSRANHWMTFRSSTFDTDPMFLIRTLRDALVKSDLYVDQVRKSMILDMLACTELLHVDPHTLSCSISSLYTREIFNSYVDLNSNPSQVLPQIS